MSIKPNLSSSKGFAALIEKPPKIFDEVVSMLSSVNVLTENELLMLKNDILCTILAVIMIENGFEPLLNDCDVFRPGTLDMESLSKWKRPSGLYEAKFILLGYCEITTKLTLVPLASNTIVNAVLPEFVSEVFSVCLPIDRYFILTKSQTEVTQMCSNLQELSDTFKDKVLSPVKSKILSLCGYPGPSLLALPEAIFLKIMLYLPVSDITSVAETCKQCNQYLGEDNFWHKLIIRDSFIVQITTQSEINWKMCYINCYKSHVKNREESRREFLRKQRRRKFCEFEIWQ